MTDNVDRATRSRIMRAIKGSGTGPEAAVARALRGLGLRPRRNVKSLPGTPDIVVGRVAVLVHGCFWHGCPRHHRPPRTNAGFWADKVMRNRARDARVRRALNRAGLSVAVVWEHEDPGAAAARITERARLTRLFTP